MLRTAGILDSDEEGGAAHEDGDTRGKGQDGGRTLQKQAKKPKLKR